MSWNGFILRTSNRIFFAVFFLALSPYALGFDLEGEVKLKTPLPAPEFLEVPKEHTEICGTKKRSPRLEISPEGGVANAVVKLEGITPKDFSIQKEFSLDQKDCEFYPHILLIPQGATLSIVNSDGTLHNVRAFNERAEMLFNDAMPKKGQVLKKRFDEPGRITVRCGIHHWMHAVAVIEEHPYYALTDSSGYFKIEGIPEGNYKLSVWQESLGEMKKEVGPKTGFLVLMYGSDKASNK